MKLGRLWGPFYRLTRPGGPRIVFHWHRWVKESWVDDGGQVIAKVRHCYGCATTRDAKEDDDD
jgi:hypothetical protein